MPSVTVMNNKGGVLKTTTAVMVAVEVASRGFRVLIGDMDPQANTTHYLLPEKLLPVQQARYRDVRDVLVAGMPVDAVILPTRFDTLDLLPASHRMIELEQELAAMPARERRLRLSLRPVLDNYDLIVWDCPSALANGTINALGCSQWVLIPIPPEYYAITGMIQLLGWLDGLRALEITDADLLGIVRTKADLSLAMTERVRRELLAAGWPVFDTPIPKRAGVERYVERRITVRDHGMLHTDLRVAWRGVADEAIQRMGLQAPAPTAIGAAE